MVLVGLGAVLLLAGIVFEGFYVTNYQFMLYGTQVTQSTYLVTGLIFIAVGLLLSWAGVKIPKLQAVQSDS